MKETKQSKITDHFKPKQESQEESGSKAIEEEEKKGEDVEESKEVQEMAEKPDESETTLKKRGASDKSSAANALEQYFQQVTVDTVASTEEEYTGVIGGLLTVQVVQIDITKETTDAITNAANEHLMHGGGVAGAISSKGGPAIQKESSAYVRKHGAVKTGTCAATGAGKLKCKYVIHAVGPIWNNRIPAQENVDALHAAIYNTLVKAHELKCQSVSIPAISSGIFGFPKPLCARVFFRALKQFVVDVKKQEVALNLKLVRLSNFDSETTEIFQDEFATHFDAST